ncbi:MAG: histidine phosphatase family protein [Clostridia bacterium]|nr:histidine phosphatase family protein [Clostridia bacterium]
MQVLTELYLVRHGQSVANVNNIMAGHSDPELTELGITQAKITANAVKDLGVSAIYSSDLKRAYQTAKETAKIYNLPITTSENLREMHMGDWEGVSFEEINNNYGDEYTKNWKENFGTFRSPNGESVKEVLERVEKELTLIAKKHKGEKVLVFVHGGVIRAFFANIIGLFPDRADELPWATNASYSTAIFDGENFQFKNYSVDDFIPKDMISIFKG